MGRIETTGVYEFAPADVVVHRKDDSLSGVIVEVDDDCGGLTTCRVVWGATSLSDALATPRADQDIQWTSKLVRVS